MNGINAIIVDDEKFSQEVLKTLLDKIPEVKVLETFSNPMNAINFLKENVVDLVFLDIHMPDLDGFDFLNNLANPPYIIITTADKEKALKAFEYSKIKDYLVKPITFPRLVKSIANVSEYLPVKNEVNNDYEDLFIKVNKRLVKVNFNDILYIEANGDYVFVFTDKERYVFNSTLKKIEDRLQSNSFFIKVHRSYIVNIKKISDIKDNSIDINKKIIPLSKTHKKNLMDQINLL